MARCVVTVSDAIDGVTHFIVQERCPEWKKEEVENFVKTNLQFLGVSVDVLVERNSDCNCFVSQVLAIVSMVFLVVGLIGAAVLRSNLVGYQTDTI